MPLCPGPGPGQPAARGHAPLGGGGLPGPAPHRAQVPEVKSSYFPHFISNILNVIFLHLLTKQTLQVLEDV